VAIEGDLRFLSHLDCVRAIERAAARGRVPLRFSQGFNPHPVLSLACARPVGVATRDDLVILGLAEPMQGEELLRRVNGSAPRGMRFSCARPVRGRRAPRPQRITCELPLNDARRRCVAARLRQLAEMPSWPVERVKPPKRPSRRARRRCIDLKELLESVALDSGTLRWTVRPRGDLWAQGGEVLRLVGLGEPAEVARVVRTAIEYDL